MLDYFSKIYFLMIISDVSKTGGQDHGKLPEWMIDGPTSQLDTMEFTGFQDIEEEKKGESLDRL